MRDLFKPDKFKVTDKIRKLLIGLQNYTWEHGRDEALKVYQEKFKNLIWDYVIEGQEDGNSFL